MKPTGNSPNIPNFHMHKESLKNIEPLVSCWSLKYWPHVGSMQMKWYVTSIFSSLSLASPTTAVVQFKTRCSNLWVSTVKMFNPFLGSFSKNVSVLNQVFFPAGLTTPARGGVTWKTLMTWSGNTATTDTAAGTGGTPSKPPPQSQPLGPTPGRHPSSTTKSLGTTYEELRS